MREDVGMSKAQKYANKVGRLLIIYLYGKCI